VLAGRQGNLGSTTNYLYDRANVVQELQAAAPTANLLTGLGIDEPFLRTDAAGARSFLADALGSTLGLTDSTGTLQTQYTYEPFGNTTASGLGSANPFQYTGRENDGTGLYFYRARYYSPTLQRFISEDPLDLGGGDLNLYAYVRNSPTNFTDSSGMIGPLLPVPMPLPIPLRNPLPGRKNPCPPVPPETPPPQPPEPPHDKGGANPPDVPLNPRAQQVFGQVSQTVGPSVDYLIYGSVAIPAVVIGAVEAAPVVTAAEQAFANPTVIDNLEDFAQNVTPSGSTPRTWGGVLGKLLGLLFK